MTGASDITLVCFSSNLVRIVANKIEQSFYSVYSYSGIESIEHALIESIFMIYMYSHLYDTQPYALASQPTYHPQGTPT